MKRILKSRNFWLGAGVGVLAGPIVLGRVAPSLKARIPQ